MKKLQRLGRALTSVVFVLIPISPTAVFVEQFSVLCGFLFTLDIALSVGFPKRRTDERNRRAYYPHSAELFVIERIVVSFFRHKNTSEKTVVTRRNAFEKPKAFFGFCPLSK